MPFNKNFDPENLATIVYNRGPQPLSESMYTAHGRKFYMYAEGTLEVSISHSDLETYANLVFGGTTFSPAKNISWPLPGGGSQVLENVSRILPLVESDDPIYSYDISSNTLRLDLEHVKTNYHLHEQQQLSDISLRKRCYERFKSLLSRFS